MLDVVLKALPSLGWNNANEWLGPTANNLNTSPIESEESRYH